MTPEQLASKQRLEAMAGKAAATSFSMNSESLATMENHEDMIDRVVFAPARKICEDLQANPVPAAELTEEQQSAIYLLAGYLRMDESGKLVSIRPVAIQDRGDGGYIVAISPEDQPS